jgi:hypothetical protein
MIQPVKCAHCGNEGSFPIEHKLRINQKVCSECRNITETIWAYYFCNPSCFNSWLTVIANYGLECRDCHGTGDSGGFKFNGPCTTCNGQGTIRSLQ